MDVIFPYPKECDYCGFHNFKISGVVHNGGQDFISLKVKCMRCGKTKTNINTK